MTLTVLVLLLAVALLLEVIFSFIQIRDLQKQIKDLTSLLGTQGEINDIFHTRIKRIEDDQEEIIENQEALNDNQEELVENQSMLQANLQSFKNIYNDFVNCVFDNFVQKGTKKASKEKVVKKAAKRGRPKK